MPYIPVPAAAGMVKKATQSGFKDGMFPAMAAAIATAFATHIVTPSSVLFTVSGVVPANGIGIITGSSPLSGITEKGLAGSLLLQATARGLLGTRTKDMMDAVAAGLVPGLSGLILVGTVPGACAGAGTGKIVALPTAAFEAALLSGLILACGPKSDPVNMKKIASAIAYGVDLHLVSAGCISFFLASGAPVPPPVGPIPVPVAGGTATLV